MEVVEAELPDFLDPRGSYAGIGFEGNVDEHGRPLRDFYIDKHRIEEGLVLCLANSLSGHIASSFGRQFCVAIDDVERLKHHLDQQLGTVSQMRACDYTVDHNRNHFLKAIDDAWQDEFRMFWPIADGSRSVTLEAGTGTVVAIPASIEMTDEEASRITRLRAESEIAAQRNNAPRPRVPDEVLRAIGWIK